MPDPKKDAVPASPTPEPADAKGLDRKGTDLAAALEVAAAAIPPFYVPRIVLLSDGNPTHRRRAQGRRGAAGQGRGADRPAAGPHRARGPALGRDRPGQVLQGEPFNVEVLIDSNHDDDQGTGRGLSRRHQGRRPGRSSSRRARTGSSSSRRSTLGGLTPITARLKGYQDTLLDNNSDFGLVSAAGKPRVLLVESDPDQAKHLTWALEEQNMQVDVRPPRGAPDNLAELQNYDLLVLSNVPATALDPAADGSGPDLRAGPGRRADHAGRRPVVRPGGLLQDHARGDPAGPQRLREGEGEAEPGDDAGDRQVGLDGRREDRDGQGSGPGGRRAAGAQRQGRRARLRGGELLGQRDAPVHRQGLRARPDRRARGRRRHRHGPGHGGGPRDPAGRPWPSSST